MESNHIQMFAKIIRLLLFIEKNNRTTKSISALYIGHFILHLECGAGWGNISRILLLVYTIIPWISLDNRSSSPTTTAEGSNFNLGFNFLPSSTPTVVKVEVEVEVAAKIKFFSVLASGLIELNPLIILKIIKHTTYCTYAYVDPSPS